MCTTLRPEYYGTADLYLCPTTKASFGITLLEAMACGTPLVASDIIGFRELVDGGGEAVLVPPRRPDAWADAVAGLIGDPSRRAAMGAAGRVKAGESAAGALPHLRRRTLEESQPRGDRTPTAEALPGIIADARAAGYAFHSLAELY
jgi:phosphatidylinositol alpha-mannosyltransferase